MNESNKNVCLILWKNPNELELIRSQVKIDTWFSLEIINDEEDNNLFN